MGDWAVPGYTDVRELGHHDAARTVLAIHSATGLPVAIRYLADTLCQDADYLAGYREDARLVAGVESPNIAEMYEYVESGHGVATVREFVGGASLRKVLPASGLGPAAALSVLKAGLLGLAAAHERGVTHRSYKPDNMLIDAAGRAKLSDFAMAGDRSTGSTGAEDVRAAFATFTRCLAGSGARSAELPKKMRGLTGPGTDGDAPALLTALDTAGRASAGTDWEAKGRKLLATLVNRSHRRGGG